MFLGSSLPTSLEKSMPSFLSFWARTGPSRGLIICEPDIPPGPPIPSLGLFHLYVELTDDDRQEHPDVEGHGDEHQEVADAELDEVEQRL